MNEEEKLNQLQAIENQNNPEQINDLSILIPKNIEWSLGERTYELHPLRFKEIELLEEIDKLDATTIKMEDLSKIVDLVSRLLTELDKEYIKENLDAVEMVDLFNTIKTINYTGIPANKKKALMKKV